MLGTSFIFFYFWRKTTVKWLFCSKVYLHGTTNCTVFVIYFLGVHYVKGNVNCGRFVEASYNPIVIYSLHMAYMLSTKNWYVLCDVIYPNSLKFCYTYFLGTLETQRIVLLFSHSWWGPFIKFTMRSTIKFIESTIFSYSGST